MAEKLLDELRVIGADIQAIIRNYKKDSASRKTSIAYYQERLNRIQGLLCEFKLLNSKVISQELPEEHEYLTSDYFHSICELGTEFQEVFKREILKLDQPTTSKGNTNPSKESSSLPIAQQRTQSNNNPQSEGIVRRFTAKLASVERFLTGLSDNIQHQQPNYVQVKRDLLQNMWQQLEELHDSIWDQFEDPIAVGADISKYIDLETKAQDIQIQLSTHTGDAFNTAPTATHSSIIPLPKLVIPRFDGSYLKWNQFFDLFSHMVDKQTIPNVQKMYYLKSNLSGEAERLVSHLAVSEENYISAWNLLQERYNNKRLLASSLVQRLLNQPTETGSSGSIKALHDTTQECLLALDNIGIKTDNWDPLLLQILIKKLDRNTHMRYEQSISRPKEVQSIHDFLAFLETHFQSLEALGTKGKGQLPTANSLTSVVTPNNKAYICKICKTGNHPIYTCKVFLAMTPADRLKNVQRERLCTNCLRFGHLGPTCSSRSCSTCGKRHNSLLHLSNAVTDKKPTVEGTATVLATSTERRGYVLLGTVQVGLTSVTGNIVTCRAVLDSGSQINLMTDKLARRLQLIKHYEPLSVEGIGQRKGTCKGFVSTTLVSKSTSYNANIKAFILPKIITQQPSRQFDISTWNLPQHLKLADPDFNVPGEIDLLLGAELYHHLLTDGQFQLAPNLPMLQNTTFGWMVCGRIDDIPANTLVCGICSEDEEDLDTILTKFWQLDDVQSNQDNFSEAERKCEEHFALTTTRDSQGRFVVRLPYKADRSSLGDSLMMTTHRFHSLEQRLQKNPDLQRQYIEFMREYERLGHMEKVNREELIKPYYVIPHHCVLKLDSTTTKLRVVFDASAKTSTGLSLNDITYAGPVVQSDLSSILLRFRLHRFVFTTDVEKMYRQILVHPNDRNMQLIQWREQPQDRLQFYRLNTVTYGTRPAPYLATKCLQQLAINNMDTLPLGAKTLRHDFYVDDGLSGSNSLVEASEIQRQLIKIASSAGFKLRKWCANHAQLLEGTPIQDQEVSLEFDDESSRGVIKTLGLIWRPRSDELCIKVTDTFNKKITKRTVTSEMARIYDPLGLIAPVIVKAKIFIQELWLLKIDWDTEIPIHLQEQWSRFRNQLESLNDLRIPRHVLKHKKSNSMELHVFTDASERAYGAAIYVRSENTDGTITVQLLCSKSRVAPLKTQTIPRLELCAALLGAEFVSKVKQDLQWQTSAIYLWTDSEIVLHWINSEAASFQTFVSHRISKIQELALAIQWRHVISKDNPADVISRGISPSDIQQCTIWFFGPLFLHGPKGSWPPRFGSSLSPTKDLEIKRHATVLITSSKDASIQMVYDIDHKGSCSKLQRIIGYVLRFISNTRLRRDARVKETTLSTTELNSAMVIILRAIQRCEFGNDIHQLAVHKQLRPNNSLASLTPFLDSHGLIRVGGRLQNADLPFDSRHPVLLPYNDGLVKLIMTQLHEDSLHCGPQALLAQTRQRFWPIKGKIMARSVVQHCVRCTRARPKMFNQIMGNLPQDRVTLQRPFLNTGVDFCGPFWIHFKLRGKRPCKAYIAVFCCFATKAVHLELVSDLTTDAFIGALTRFIYRRGRCKNLYCDNATNFVGARNQLQELKDTIYEGKAKEKIHDSCSKRGISFHFIPPRAPHFGGLWEAAVKSAKHLLVRGVGDASLTYEELETVTIQVEGILNSRPITPMSSDPNDLTALTPGHFLIGEPITAHPTQDSRNDRSTTLQRWRLVNYLKDQFWSRWSNEYLNELQHRTKWKAQSTAIKPGTMVIIKEDNIPPLRWPLGRIINTFTGDDGHVRVVDVQTASGPLRRAIHRLAPLFPEETTNSTNDDEPQLEHTSKTEDKDDDENESRPEQVKKRKLNSNLYMATIIAIILCLPVVLCNPVKIIKYANQPGIHFDSIGKNYVVSTHWNLVIYYDLEPLRNELAMLQNGTSIFRLTCAQVKHEMCENLQLQFLQAAKELQMDGALFLPRLPRMKRGAVNLVGNIANSLFGVLDSEYAEKMSQTIKGIEGNDHFLLDMLKNQTSIIDSTINILKHDQEAVRSKFKTYDKVAIDVVSLFSLAVQLIISTTKLQRAQTMIINVLTDVHHGQVGPLLLSPEQLRDEIVKIKAHLPPGVRFPVEQDDLLHLYKLMSVQGGLTSHHVLFKITIPLIGSDEFNMYRVYPIPALSNDTMIAIQPTTEFISITAHGDSYFPMTLQQFNACMNLREQVYLCPLQQPIHHKGSATNMCEINLFNNETQLSCQVFEVLTDQWMQLNNKNQWIYALKHPIKFRAVCGDDNSQFALEGSGLLEMQPECTVKHDQVTLVGHQVLSTSIIPSVTSHNNWAHLYDPKTAEPILLENAIRPYDIELKELSAFQEALKTQQ